MNEPYRAMYPASLMSRPDYGGKVIRTLETGKTYVVLGQVEHFWMALADEGSEQLIGYVPMRAVIKADQYEATVRKQALRPKARKKTTCVDVDGNSKACKDSANGTDPELNGFHEHIFMNNKNFHRMWFPFCVDSRADRWLYVVFTQRPLPLQSPVSGSSSNQ